MKLCLALTIWLKLETINSIIPFFPVEIQVVVDDIAQLVGGASRNAVSASDRSRPTTEVQATNSTVSCSA
jgi:hypothetical protein